MYCDSCSKLVEENRRASVEQLRRDRVAPGVRGCAVNSDLDSLFNQKKVTLSETLLCAPQ
jgi:hypothetical protein